MSKTYKFVELLPWTEFLDVHLKKDPVLFPCYIAKHFKIPFEIVFIRGNKQSTKITNLPFNGKIIGLHPTLKKRITKLTDLRRIFFLFPLIKYIIKNRNFVSHYMLFHLTDNSFTLAYFIKLFSPNAKIWLKLDASIEGLKDFLILISKNSTIKQRIISNRYKKILSKIDLISTETRCTYDLLKENPFTESLNIQIIPNGLEEKKSEKPNVKQNLIISVARFGTYQKNTELLLNALAKVSLGTWKVFLIGPIETKEQNFQKIIDVFFDKNPDLKEKIIFTGNINNSELIDEYYEKAKIFILPSRFESFGIAILEALSKGDYLILSDVGAARDLVKNEDFGYILPESEQNKQNEKIIEQAIIVRLQAIIDKKFNIEKNINKRIDFAKQYSMDSIVQSIAIKEWVTK